MHTLFQNIPFNFSVVGKEQTVDHKQIDVKMEYKKFWMCFDYTNIITHWLQCFTFKQ